MPQSFFQISENLLLFVLCLIAIRHHSILFCKTQAYKEIQCESSSGYCVYHVDSSNPNFINSLEEKGKTYAGNKIKFYKTFGQTYPSFYKSERIWADNGTEFTSKIMDHGLIGKSQAGLLRAWKAHGLCLYRKL